MVLFVVLDGIIGSGKTSIGRELAKLGYTFEAQPVKEEWTLLGDYYRKPAKYAFAFQKQVIASYNRICAKYINDRSTKIVFLESCALASLNTFAKMLCEHDKYITPDQYEEIKKSVAELPISLYIFIHASAAVAQDRIKAREQNPGEETLEQEYNETLAHYYAEFAKNHYGAFSYVSFANNKPDQQAALARKIALNLTGHCHSPNFKKHHDLIVLGNIGSGKTTFGQKLGPGFHFAEQKLTNRIRDLLTERYELMSSGRKVGAVVVALQKAFVDMYAEWMTLWLQRDDTETQTWCWEDIASVVPVFSKAAMLRGEISRMQFEEIEEYAKAHGHPQIENFKVALWVRPSLERTRFQISERDRDAEKSISLEYLEILDGLFAEMVRSHPNVIMVDTSTIPHVHLESMVFRRLQQVYFTELMYTKWMEPI
jgi:deoxyadenosine/deoxycytidine kinase